MYLTIKLVINNTTNTIVEDYFRIIMLWQQYDSIADRHMYLYTVCSTRSTALIMCAQNNCVVWIN